MADSYPMVKLGYSKLERQVEPMDEVGHPRVSVVIEWTTVANVVEQ